METGKDFYGKEISELIEQACRELEASREELDIEVLATGSAGIFGLCKKKAHIRVTRKAPEAADTPAADAPIAVRETGPEKSAAAPGRKKQTAAGTDPVATRPEPVKSQPAAGADSVAARPEPARNRPVPAPPAAEDETGSAAEEEAAVEPPSAESLQAIRETLLQLLALMNAPSEVEVRFADNTVQCLISGPHEERLVGVEGRSLDSLQYLLRKMVHAHLPERAMLLLDAGDFRQRRAEELQQRALELAGLVKKDGKTRVLAALNPSERRVVHMTLQDDSGVRSRSVGDGLFKKVLICKPGKGGRRPMIRRRRGGRNDRSSGN
ncbi:MAG: Jag N-terminal domain-containing protein [Desulfobulbus sp.]|jgi:spoIIIJ-associated protein